MKEGLKPNFVISVKPGENHKNLQTVIEIWQKLIEYQCDKTTLLVLVGGGVIGDMGGFAASTFIRGIDFVHIPTTIISQVDSSMGGKTAINFSGGKNIIGLFNQPKFVFIQTQFLKTLPSRDFISGFAEIIKHGLIADENYYDLVTSKKPRDFSNQEMENIIAKSCEIKSKIIADDVLQQNNRKLVLFGHTIGQAIEAASLKVRPYLTHGEAISVGMVAETYLSTLIFSLPRTKLEELEKRLLFSGLPIRTNIIEGEITSKLKMDKKIRNGKINWTLLKKIGVGTYGVEVDDTIVTRSIKYVCNSQYVK